MNRKTEQSVSKNQNVSPPEIRRRSFIVIFCGMVCLGMGHSIMFTTLPPLSRDIGLDEQQVGTIFSLSAVLWVVMSPFWGRRSDIWGRRPALIIGLLGFAISQFIFASMIQAFFWGMLSVTVLFPILIGSRTIYGCFGSSAPPAAQAYVADRTSRETRAKGVATMGAAFMMGMTIAPGFAGLFAWYSLLAPFYAVGSFALLFAALIFFMVPEKTRPKSKARDRSAPEGGRLLPWDSRIWPFVMTNLLFQSSNAMIFQTITFLYLDKLGLEATEATSLAMIGMMSSSMGTLISQLVLVPRLNLSARNMMIAGLILSIPAFLIMIFAQHYTHLVFAQMLMGLAGGLAGPGFMAGASLAVSQKEQGSVAGIMNGSNAFGFILTPFIGMPLYQENVQYPYILAAVLVTLALIGLFALKQLREAGTSVPTDEEMLKDADERQMP